MLIYFHEQALGRAQALSLQKTVYDETLVLVIHLLGLPEAV